MSLDCTLLLASRLWTMTERCARSGISRNSGDKWRERCLALGVMGLAEHSHAVDLAECNVTGRTRTITGAPYLKKDC